MILVAYAFLKGLPWQVWALVLGLIAVGAYGCTRYDAGQQAERQKTETQQQKAADNARQEVDRLRGGADRSRVQQFDRD